jgi:hypothetical protein
LNYTDLWDDPYQSSSARNRKTARREERAGKISIKLMGRKKRLETSSSDPYKT